MVKVLIISCNAIGDTYLSASALEALRNFAPSLEFHFIVQRNSNFLLKHLHIDKIYFIDSKSITNIFNLIKRIRNDKYSIVFTFFPGLVNTLFFYSVKSEIKAGFPNFIKRNQWYNISQKSVTKGISNKGFTWQPEMNYLVRISKLLELTGIDPKYVKKPIYDNLKLSVNHTIDGITVHYKATDSNRSISNDDVIKLIGELFDNGINKITLIGIERDFNNQIIQFCKKTNVEIIVNPSLQKLLDLILDIKLFVGVDSFPLHIADAYNTNFLGIFGPTFPSSVLVNSNKSIRFEYSNYLKIDIRFLVEKITAIYEKT